MIRYRYRPLILFAVLAAAVVSAEDGSRKDESRNKGDNSPDLACGPRCVQFVLEYYGISAELIPLMRETQWFQLERGASLGRLRDALESRGIHTAMIQVDPAVEIAAAVPIIRHIQNSRGDGHFVIQLNRDREKVIWDGLNGYREGLPDGFRSTGIALIASRDPLTDSSWHVVDGWLWHKRVLGLSCLVLSGWCMLQIARRFKRQGPLVGETSQDIEALSQT